MLPDAATCNLAAGAAVPIPTLPPFLLYMFESITISPPFFDAHI